MKHLWQIVWLVAVLTAFGVPGNFQRGRCVYAQPFVSLPGSRFELSKTVQLDRADGTVLEHDLERVKAFLDARQWDEAIEGSEVLINGLDPENGSVWQIYYLSLDKAGRRDDAIQARERFLQLRE